MTRTVLVSIAGLGLVLALLLGFAAAGLAVREGALSEIVYWFPPQARYQLILRIGSDEPPWSYQGRAAAINLWVHDQRREGWHIVSLLRVPLGGDPPERDQPPPYYIPPAIQ